MTLPYYHVSFSATPTNNGTVLYEYEFPVKVLTHGPGNPWKDLSHITFRTQCPDSVINLDLTTQGVTVEGAEYLDTFFKIDLGDFDEGVTTWNLSFESMYLPTEGMLQIKSGAGQQGSQVYTFWPGKIPGCEIIPEPGVSILVALGVAIALVFGRRRR